MHREENEYSAFVPSYVGEAHDLSSYSSVRWVAECRHSITNWKTSPTIIEIETGGVFSLERESINLSDTLALTL